MLDSLSPQRRRLVLGIGGLVLALLTAVVVFAVVRSRSSTRPVAQTIPGPVLLVPGYGGRVASLQPLVSALRSTGRTAVVVEPVGDGAGDLEIQADHLAEVAQSVLKQTAAPSVDVVGYSAGGVVARLWIRDAGGKAPVRRVLTLGSPQHGTSQAALGLEFAGSCSVACEQLVPDSDLLRHLNAGDETPDGQLWATVRSNSDRVVTPVDSAALAGAVNIVVQDICPGSTVPHGDLPANPVVLAALDSVLGAGPPQAPTGVSC